MNTCPLPAAFAAAALILGTLPSHAADHFVSLTGGHVPPFTSWADAATNIQAAVDAASAGETVWVTNGVYATGGKVKAGTLTNRVAMDKALTVQSVNGAEVTIIEGRWDPTSTNGPGAVRCAWLADGAILRAFTLRAGATANSGDSTTLLTGGAVWGTSTNARVEDSVLTDSRAFSFGGAARSVLLSNCTVRANTAGSQGGGAYSCHLQDCLVATNATLDGGGGIYGSVCERTTLSGNSANYGGGAGYSTLNNCRLTGNVARLGGGGSHYGTLNNCAVSGNEMGSLSSAGLGGGSYWSALNNCTVTRNRALSTAPSGNAGVDSGVINNCIVWDNYWIDSTGSVKTNNCGGSLTVRYTCTINSTPVSGTGVIASDPRLLPDAVHIAADSPCRGAADAAYASGTDIDGQTWSAPPSMGCDEWASAPLVAGGPSLLTSTNATLAWLSATGTGEGPFYYLWWKDGQVMQSSPHYEAATTGLVAINGLDVGDAGTYQVAISNAYGWATPEVGLSSAASRTAS